ncbi:MAG: hypothetical protein GY861_05615 [bacterium]|nr:hypothetical protein [bacterium]
MCELYNIGCKTCEHDGTCNFDLWNNCFDTGECKYSGKRSNCYLNYSKWQPNFSADDLYIIECGTCEHHKGGGWCGIAAGLKCTGDVLAPACRYKGTKEEFPSWSYSKWEPKEKSHSWHLPITELTREEPKEDPHYKELRRVLDLAYDQAAKGKGKERHVQDEEGEAFEKQQICEITRRVGCGGPAYQAVKKIYESLGLPPERGMRELLGAINYIVGAYIVMEEKV